MRKLGKKQLSILKYLEKVGPVNAWGTRYYAGDWHALAKLRELGFIEPSYNGSPAIGSGVTDKGREYLKGLLENERQQWKDENVAQPWNIFSAKNIFSYRPRKGDIWEVRIPGKPMKRKTVGQITSEWFRRGDRDVRLPYVDWARANKGRYSGIRVKWLLKYGTLIKRIKGKQI